MYDTDCWLLAEHELIKTTHLPSPTTTKTDKIQTSNQIK